MRSSFPIQCAHGERFSELVYEHQNDIAAVRFFGVRSGCSKLAAEIDDAGDLGAEDARLLLRVRAHRVAAQRIATARYQMRFSFSYAGLLMAGVSQFATNPRFGIRSQRRSRVRRHL